MQGNFALLADDACPPITEHSVVVHYFEAGIYKQQAFSARRPSYFDRIVISQVHETLPAPPIPRINVDSPRNLLRLGYHTMRKIRSTVWAPRVFDAPVFDYRSAEANNVAHLLIAMIPGCLRARAVAGPETVFLFGKMLPVFVRVLDAFGIQPICDTTNRIEANVIRISGTRGLALHDLTKAFDCNFLDFFPDTYASFNFSTPLRFDRIFIARRGARKLQNHAEIEAIVTRYDYKTIFMEDYTVPEQLSIGAQAKHVVAIHGAAMSVLVMNKRIESVIEVLPPNAYGSLYPINIGSRVVRYEQILPEFDYAVAHRSWEEISRLKNLPFSLDAGLLERLLQDIH